MDLYTQFKTDLDIKNINFDSSTTIENFDWLNAFGTTTNRFKVGYPLFIKFRGASCAIISASCIYTLYDYANTDCIIYRPIYLTHWTLCISVIYSTTGLIATYRIHNYRDSYSINQIPTYVQIHWLLQNPVFMLSFLVPTMFWAACKISNLNTRMCDVSAEPITIFIHGINGAIIITDVIVSNQPYMVLHGVYSIGVGLAYLVWTYVHHLLQIGDCYNPNSNVPIYASVDWNNGFNVYKGFLILLGLPIVNFVGWYVYYAKLKKKSPLLIS